MHFHGPHLGLATATPGMPLLTPGTFFATPTVAKSVAGTEAAHPYACQWGLHSPRLLSIFYYTNSE